MAHIKRIWYLSPMRAAKVQASQCIRTVSPEPPLLAHTSSESRGTFRQKVGSLAPLNGWSCAVKIFMTECSKTQIRLTGLALWILNPARVHCLFITLSSWCLFMPPFSKKLRGHIDLGLSICLSAHPSITLAWGKESHLEMLATAHCSSWQQHVTGVWRDIYRCT